MRLPIHFQTHTALSQGLRELLNQLQNRVQFDEAVTVFLAGEMAVHSYTGSRATTHVDAEFSRRFFIPSDLVIEFQHDDGTTEPRYFDTNDNFSFALMHDNYARGSISLDIGAPNISLRVLSPVDLVVS